MGVCFCGEDAEDVVVLVYGLAVVAALDRVPPVGVGIAELALDGERGGEGGVGVVAVLERRRAVSGEPRLMAGYGGSYHVGVARQVLAGGFCFLRALGVFCWPSVRRSRGIALGNGGDSGRGRPEKLRTRRCSERRAQCGHCGGGVERRGVVNGVVGSGRRSGLELRSGLGIYLGLRQHARESRVFLEEGRATDTSTTSQLQRSIPHATEQLSKNRPRDGVWRASKHRWRCTRELEGRERDDAWGGVWAGTMSSPETAAGPAAGAGGGRAETSLHLDNNDHAIDIDDNTDATSHSNINGVKQENDEESHDDGNTTATTLRPNPEPSIKRRESQAALETPEGIERPGSKKRKRATSPPWQFPTAERTTLKSADGRRISARFSTNAPTPVASENESRARSSSLSAPPRSSRASSPPWKKFEAEGPTSLMVDGQRKSGRVNKELTDGKPKRVSPRSKKVADAERSHANGKVTSLEKKSQAHTRTVSGPTPKKEVKQARRESNTIDHHAKLRELQAKLDALQPTRSFPDEGQPENADHKRKRSHGGRPSHFDGSTSPSRPRKMSRTSKAPQSPEATNKPAPKLKLRFNSGRHNIPPPHPNAKVPSPVRPPGLSIHQLLDECDLRDMQQPYMENERGPPDLAWFKQRAVRQAEEERVMRQRILKAAEPGGALSPEHCSVYQEAEPQPEPPKVYTHQDHLVNHVQNFRALQIKESTNHKALAKKIANEAVEYYKKKRGPTEEDIRAEQDRIFKLIYKQVVFDVKAKWELVAQHVHNNRLKAWEREQEIKRQQRLQEKLAKSQNMVARQRGALDDFDEDSVGDIEESDVIESESDEEEEAKSNGDDNMSASESEGDAETAEDDQEDEGEWDDAAIAAYKAAQEREEQAQGSAQQSDHQDEDEQEDASMTDDLTAPATGPSSEPEPEAAPPPKSKPAATLADLFGDRVDDDAESEEDFQPADQGSQAVKDQDGDDDTQSATQVDLASRRSRRSSAAVDTDGAANLSEDDSTDMESDDCDSDEDMSDSNDEGNDGSAQDSDDEDDEGDDDADGEQGKLGAGLLAFYDKKDQEKKFALAGLPTPTTSAEGDIGDAHEEVDDKPAGDATAGAEAEGEAEHVEAEPLNKSLPKLSGSTKNAPLSKAELEFKRSMGILDDAPAEEEIENPEMEEVEDIITSPSVRQDEEGPPKHWVPQPVLLRGTLRSYQHAGLDWLASLYRNGTNGILADEMGLGKTIQTIALLAHLAEEYGCWETHLVIVPTSVVLNWVTEFQKFLPGFRVLAYYGTSEERQAKRKGWTNDPHLDDKSKRGYNVVITSYNIAMQDINALRTVQWHYLVLDEAHNIRNFNSQRWQILIRLKTQARLLLTGTPLQNSLTELWSLLTFLTAGDDDPAHGDLEEFLSHWRDPVREIFDAGVQTLSNEAQKVVDQLHISLRPFLLRRLKSEVEKDLPKKTESVVVCKLSKRQRQLYQEYMGLAEVKKSLAQGNAVSAGKVLLSLRRVCNHPDLFDPRGVESSWGMERSVAEEFGAKADVVRTLLGEGKEIPSMLIVVGHESKRRYAVKRAKQLSAKAKLHAQSAEMEKASEHDAAADPSTVSGGNALRRVRARQSQLDRLRSAIRFSEDNLSSAPVYGSDLQELVTFRRDSPYKVKVRPPPVQQPYGHALPRPPQPIVQSLRGWPQFGNRPLRFESEHPSDWLLAKDSMLQQSVQTNLKIGERLREILIRFAFVTPAVTAPNLDYLIPATVQSQLRASPFYPDTPEADYAHESRIRLSINFPDSRLLVYDSGKLQRLTILLRELQAKGSRSLIFTQMTGTLNILEQFLSLMGLPYLRLDGSTTPERRHLYASEFNRPDSKYQCMILSSRAGGVGLNLTGASSVIFYDLDWNPQMDRQCMDRAHRIGQVRDVEVFKMVSEKTVEENILRRAEQKSLLDQTVIQEGHFTTDYEIGGKGKGEGDEGDEAKGEGEEDVAAAIERFLGAGNKDQDPNSSAGNNNGNNVAFESVEDREDVAAAQRAHKEEHQDEADFGGSSNQHSGRATPATGLGEDVVEEAVDREGHLDNFMVGLWEWLVKDVPFVPPVVSKKDKGAQSRKKKSAY